MLNEEDLPDLIELNDFGGVWPDWIDAVYQRYIDDLSDKNTLFCGRPVVLRVHPETQGKGSGFWHCVSTGSVEEDRVPDPERCKRIGWIRAVIENVDAVNVDHWVAMRGNQTNHLLWWNERYLVVLSERGAQINGKPSVYLLKTAYLIEQERQRRKLRHERDAYKNQHRPGRDGV